MAIKRQTILFSIQRMLATDRTDGYIPCNRALAKTQKKGNDNERDNRRYG